MVMGWVPWRVAESGISEVGWAFRGAFAAEEAEELVRDGDVLDGREAEGGFRCD